MPVMDGNIAAREIRGRGYNGIILGVTGNAVAEDVRNFELAGADMVVIKPLDAKKFEDALSAINSKKKNDLKRGYSQKRMLSSRKISP